MAGEVSVINMNRFVGGVSIVAIVLALTACSTPEGQLADLRGAISDGNECAELFPMLKAISADKQESEDAQAEMRNIGCFTTSSERTDAARSAVDPQSAWIGVPDGQRVVVSAECSEASMLAAEEIGSEKAELLIQRTLEECESLDEWLSALEEYPGVMGMVDGYIPSVTEVQSACIFHSSTPVCRDAADRGI